MGIAERREREKEQRRNDIIDAAERVFFSKGRHAATMDDVAEEAELSKGTLYLYFKNKEDLYLAINLRGLKILSTMFTNAVSKHKTGIEKVKAVGEAYYQFYVDFPNYFNALIYWESHEIDLADAESWATECNKQGHESLDILVRAIQQGIEDNTLREDIDPVKTALFLWGSTSGLIQLMSMKGDHLQEDHGLNREEFFQYSFGLIHYMLKEV